jgi:hypothetical protein
MDGNFKEDGGSKRMSSVSILSRGFLCVTVKTSSLVQKCKTILTNASNLLFNFKISHSGNLEKISFYTRLVIKTLSFLKKIILKKVTYRNAPVTK